MTAEDVVGELSSGMTVGIGGWGSRRKPMALVRAILRSDLTDLTLVSYGGPDVGLLMAAGKVRRVVCGFVSLDTIPLEPHFRLGRQAGHIELDRMGRGDVHGGLLAAAHRLPFLPTRAGLGSDVLRVNPQLRTVRSPYSDSEELVAVPALCLDAALVHMNRADRPGNAQYLGPDPYFDDLFCRAAVRRFVSCERLVDTAELLAGAPAAEPAAQPLDGRRRRGDATWGALHQLHAGLRQGRGFPEGVRGFRGEPRGLGGLPRHLPVRGRGRLPGGGSAFPRRGPPRVDRGTGRRKAGQA